MAGTARHSPARDPELLCRLFQAVFHLGAHPDRRDAVDLFRHILNAALFAAFPHSGLEIPFHAV